jgi:hypothetical protein
MMATDLIQRFNGLYTAEELLAMVLENMDITERNYVIGIINTIADEMNPEEDFDE